MPRFWDSFQRSTAVVSLVYQSKPLIEHILKAHAWQGFKVPKILFTEQSVTCEGGLGLSPHRDQEVDGVLPLCPSRP